MNRKKQVILRYPSIYSKRQDIIFLNNFIKLYAEPTTEKMNKIEHWENVYSTKKPQEVSWTQEKPVHSLNLISTLGLPKNAKIIDVGGGDSNLVDFLLDEGYQNITVLDISQKAIERAQMRLGEKAQRVTWIVSDIVDFEPSETYDVWHDRATFHFLTSVEQIQKYVSTVSKALSGKLILATFSDEGPLKCSGLEISQYTPEKLTSIFSEHFILEESFTDDHTTPFNTLQNFLYCMFSKK